MTDETLFAAALESPDRGAFLAQTCPDVEQRARVERLLAAHDRATGFLQNPAAPRAAFETRDHVSGEDYDLDDALGFLTPSQRSDSLGRIGHYEVLEILGRGGFGIVFRAFDETLQRVVAVKVLAPSMAATSPARKRFLREARSSAAIRHENVVQVHAVEEQPLPLIVMEFVPGESLQQRLDRAGPLEPAEVLAIGRQVAEGLAAAHATGVVHRDIKPANILVEPTSHRSRITDFGLARAADDASLTRSGTVAGTPLYMAPEQAKGESLDHRADLFSLGSVMYALLTGHPPFRAETTLAVLKRVADDTPRPIREIIPEVPDWFCRIVEKLHAKTPADRYQTAREVADVLADCEQQLAAHKELKDTSRIPAPASRPCRSRRWNWAAGIAFVLLFAAVWFGRFTLLYANNVGEVELLPQEGLVDVIVLKDDRGEFDDNDPKVRAVTDWIGMKKSHTLKLPPGKYKLNAGTWPAGRMAGQWEVDHTGPFGSIHLLTSGRSLIFEVERGKRVRIRPVIWNDPSVRPPDTPPSPPTPASTPSDGFVSLFNGKDLTGWQEFPAGRGSWKVENGILVAHGKPSHLFTRRGDFANFHLRMETRIKSAPSGGAVGVFARVPLEDPKMILAPHGRDSLFRIPVPKLYDASAPPPNPPPPTYREQPIVVWGTDHTGEKLNIKAMPADEWFTHEFILDGQNAQVRTATQGASSSSYRVAGAPAPNGHIALQLFDDRSVVEFRKIEIKEVPPAKSANSQPVVLRKFDPAKDKPTLPWGDPKNVRPEDGGWRIENATNMGNFRAHLGTLTDDLPTEGLIVFRAKVKVKANDKLAWGSLQLGIGGPKFHGYDWPEERGTYRGDVPEWTEKELRYPASIFHQTNPPVIPVYVGMYANGVVWVKDAEVLHIPVDPQRAAVLNPLRDAVKAATSTLGLTKKRYEAGAVTKIELLRAEGHVIAARVEYAEAEGNTKAVVERLEELVKACQEERDLIEVRVKAGAFRGDELNPAEVRLAQAKARLAKAKSGGKTGPNPAVVEPLRDAVNAMTSSRDLAKKRFDVGTASKGELLRAEAELIDARIALAEAEGDAAAVVARLEELVKARQEERDLTALRVEKGRDTTDALNQSDAKLAEAKVRLAKVKKP